MTHQFVELAEARDAEGIRIVTPLGVPSPWALAAKGLFRLASVPVRIVRADRSRADVHEWTKCDNYPVVFHDKDLPRTSWSPIVALAARLAPQLLPTDLDARAKVAGLIDLIAGEDGLGWNARLIMVDAGFRTEGAKGFIPPVGKYLVQRYDSARIVKKGDALELLRERCGAQIAVLDQHLAIADGDYFGGKAPNALDVYTAAFLIPLGALDETTCPGISPMARQGFAGAADALGALVPNSLIAHRTRMFEKHLGWPLEI
ncbi:MAG TPA: hypothetical protein VGM90_14475 [Kofleriaceae bacterium]|jgi:glutathione S-transferase